MAEVTDVVTITEMSDKEASAAEIRADKPAAVDDDEGEVTVIPNVQIHSQKHVTDDDVATSKNDDVMNIRRMLNIQGWCMVGLVFK